MPTKVEISHKTIIFTFFFAMSLWFLYFIRDILLQLFVAMLLVTILNPLISRLAKYRIPKAVSILLSFVLTFGFLGVVIGSILPPLVEQTTNLANGLPGYFAQSELSKYLNEDVTRQIVSQLGTLPSQIIKAGFSLFGNVMDIFAVLIFTFYLLMIRDKFDTTLTYLFGQEKSRSIIMFIDELEINLGGWFRGQLTLMLLIGILSYIGFIILGIPYALPLALLASVFEIIPYIGPVAAAIPVIILGFNVSPFLGFAALGLTVLIQQLENYVFVPKIMEKSTGVSPIIILVSLAVGFKLAGIVGMIIAIPIVIIIQTYLILNGLKRK